MRAPLIAAIALASAVFGQATSQTNHPIVLSTSAGPATLVGTDFGWLAQNAQTINLGQEATGPGNGQFDTMPCRHELDLNRIKRGATALLRRWSLTPNSSLVEGQLFILTSPKLSTNTAALYSFTAAMSPCVNVCSVRVSASKIVAPYDGALIRMDRATKQDDDITGALINVVEDEFDKCANR